LFIKKFKEKNIKLGELWMYDNKTPQNKKSPIPPFEHRNGARWGIWAKIRINQA